MVIPMRKSRTQCYKAAGMLVSLAGGPDSGGMPVSPKPYKPYPGPAAEPASVSAVAAAQSLPWLFSSWVCLHHQECNQVEEVLLCVSMSLYKLLDGGFHVVPLPQDQTQVHSNSISSKIVKSENRRTAALPNPETQSRGFTNTGKFRGKGFMCVHTFCKQARHQHLP